MSIEGSKPQIPVEGGNFHDAIVALNSVSQKLLFLESDFILRLVD